MSIHIDRDDITQDSKEYEHAINMFVHQWNGSSDTRNDKSSSTNTSRPQHEYDIVGHDERSITSESIKLHQALNANPRLVKNLLHSSPWYNAYIANGEKSSVKGDEASLVDQATIGSASDPLSDFSDLQLFQLQQYRIAELTSQLDLVKNSVSEYHDLLEKFQYMQQENRVLTHKVSLLEQQLRKRLSVTELQKHKLEKNKQIVKLRNDETERLRAEVASLKLQLTGHAKSSAGTTADRNDAEKTRILEATVVKLKMDLANSKSREDWHRLKRNDSSSSHDNECFGIK